MSEQNSSETDLAIAAISNSISVINSLASKVHNVVYDSTTNKTKIYGHTNFEELNVLGSPVALQSQLTSKANVSHTHKTDDISRDITTITLNANEEEEETTETKTLNDILDDKADSNHNHDSSYAVLNHNHDGTYAKLSTNNTFTGYNAFNCPNGGNVLTALSSNASSYNAFILGKSTTLNGCSVIRYNVKTTPELAIGFYGNDGVLTVKSDRSSVFNGTVSAPAITLNGTDLSTTLSSKASSSHTHTLSEITDYTPGSSSSYSITQPSLNWTETRISNTARIWNDVCYANGKFVAVASNSTAAYSNDGITWTETTISNTSKSWYGVCYGNGKFVAVANEYNKAAYSYDGITWTETTISSTTRNWCGVCYGNGKFVAVSYNSKISAYSNDGITWTETTSSTYIEDRYDVCYGDGKFVAVNLDSRKGAYSNDGITWTETTISNTSKSWRSVCYGNGKYVAIADYSTTAAYSIDGITWTETTISSESRAWSNVCYGNGKFVSVEYYSTIGAISNDGITWTEITISNTDRTWESVCYGNGKFVAMTNDSTIGAYTNIQVLTCSNDLDSLSQKILQRIYPIGAIYTSMNNINPALLFGFGTWKAIVNKFLYCSDGLSEQTGGEAEHILTTQEMPSHQHVCGIYLSTNTYGGNPDGTHDCIQLQGWQAGKPYYGTPPTSSTGGGKPHNNMPPYITVFAWQRTA